MSKLGKGGNSNERVSLTFSLKIDLKPLVDWEIYALHMCLLPPEASPLVNMTTNCDVQTENVKTNQSNQV